MLILRQLLFCFSPIATAILRPSPWQGPRRENFWMAGKLGRGHFPPHSVDMGIASVSSPPTLSCGLSWTAGWRSGWSQIMHVAADTRHLLVTQIGTQSWARHDI